MAGTLQLVVETLHVLLGVAWVGGLLFFGHAFLGGVGKLREEVRSEATLAGIEKAATLSAVAGPLTLILGLWNQYLVAGQIRFQGSTWHTLIGASVILTLAALGAVFGLVWPSLRALQQDRGNPGEHEARARRGILAAALAGVAIVILMVWAGGTAPA